jgi:transposase
MRKSFITLAALVRNQLSLDPLSGAAFLFTNKSRKLIKILYFDGTGGASPAKVGQVIRTGSRSRD